MRPVLIVGDSHIVAIKRGADLLPDAQKARLTFWPLGNGGAVREPCHSYDRDLQEVTTTSPVWQNRVFSKDTISAIGPDAVVAVSLPLNTSRILRDYSWHTHAPWHLARGEFALSGRMVERMIDDDSVNALNLVRDLSQVWPALAVIEAPRFFPDAAYLKKARLDVCRYIDECYRNRVAATIGQFGLDVIAQPRATITDQGTTSLLYDHPDPGDDHHANAAYGHLVLEDLFRHVDELG